jgi:hypothetical protein
VNLWLHRQIDGSKSSNWTYKIGAFSFYLSVKEKTDKHPIKTKEQKE